MLQDPLLLPLLSITPSYAYEPPGPCAIEDVLAPGFIVGEGCSLQGEPICLVSIISRLKLGDDLDSAEPAGEYEVIRRIGSGSRAVVYLAKEVLFHSLPLEDDYRARPSAVGLGDDITRCSEKVYGREYAIKCLCKANFNEEALVGQFNEAIIHQSLHSHPNIVTLHKTFHTSSFLLLLLEYVPGEDLLHFLAEAHDYYGTDTPNPVSFTRAPPTCNLFSGQHPSRLLSQARLRLIASMFRQMCDAVATCHSQQVYHRDIKPENFIVTEGWTTLPDMDGRQERKVTVKLTNFSLSTTDVESSDMDCGSVPYMSYEYRNYLAPTYRPRAADVWSLGIVLLNMLYHFNPWTDTSQGACASFDLFRRDPVHFFMYRFAGMTQPVADFLANRVFCILDDSRDDSCRVTAGEFGVWVKNLPLLLGCGHDTHRTFSSRSIGYSITLTSCSPSISTQLPRTPAVTSRPQPHALLPGPPKQSNGAYGPSRVRNQKSKDYSQQREGNLVELLSGEMRAQNEDFTPQMMSTAKHKKHGVRKAVASQNLSPEISTMSRVFSTNPITFKGHSKSKLLFDMQSTGLSRSALEDHQPPPPALPPELGIPDSQPDFVKANNVTNFIMRFNDPAHNLAPGRVNNTQGKPLTQTGDHGWQGFAPPIAQTNESAGYGLPSTLNTWNLGAWNSSGKRSTRAVSPDSVHGSGRPLASSTSSTTSGDDCSCYYSCMSTTMSLASWRADSEGARSPASSTEGTRQRFNEVKGGLRPLLAELYDQAQGSRRRVTTSAVTSWITEPEKTIRTSLWTFSSVKNEGRGYGMTVRDIFERQLRLRRERESIGR